MLLGIGTRVKFLRTPDSGKITAKLGDGMVMVHLDDMDMEIPAFEEDLLREEAYLENNDLQKTLIEYPHLAKQKKEKELPLSITASSTPIKPNFTNAGIQMAFQAQKKSNGEIDKFDVLLLNDTHYDLLFEFNFVIFNDITWSKDGKLSAVSFEKLGELFFDEINDLPQTDVTISPISTEGVGEKLYKTLKIKPKQFFKNAVQSTFLNCELYIFPLFESLLQNDEAPSDLKKYTNEIIKVKKIEQKKRDDSYRFDPVADVNEYATFVNEIDLHIELLHNNPQVLSSVEIVNFQMRAFETFLSKAIRLGIKKIFIIHGVGKGRLKDMIHARLRRHPDITTFRNEYYEKYGWGATEIIL